MEPSQPCANSHLDDDNDYWLCILIATFAGAQNGSQLAQPVTNQNHRCGAQLSETVRMAVIINTAMERVVCGACDVLGRVKCSEIFPKVLRKLARKWFTWMHFMTLVVTDCHICELGCRKIDKSWTKEDTPLMRCFQHWRIADNVITSSIKLLHVYLFMLKKLQNDI